MIDQSEFYNQFCTQTVGTDWCVLEKFFPEVEGAFFPEKEDVFKGQIQVRSATRFRDS